MKSSPELGGDAVRTGDASGDDWSRELTRARVVQGLKEMVVALVEVGDCIAAAQLAACLRKLEKWEKANRTPSDWNGGSHE